MPPAYSYAVPSLYLRRRTNAWKDVDKNLLSGIVSVVVVVVVSASLSQPQWFWLEGGGCQTTTLGLYLFLHPGSFKAVKGEHLTMSSPHVTYMTGGEEYKFCVTPEIVFLIRIVIGLIFLVIMSSLVQMLLDIAGPTNLVLVATRKNGVPSIFAVLVCVVAVGLCYYVTTLIEHQQEATKPLIGPATALRVQVKLDVGFYLLICGGGLSVIAVGCNWLRPLHIFHESDSSPLVDEWGGLEGLESFSIPPGGPPLPPLSYLHDREPPPPMEGHPPPPYSP